MDLPHMRTLYETGRLSEAMVITSQKDNAWLVDCHDLWGHTLHLTDTEGEICRYPSLDHATQAALTIGFNQVNVVEH